MHSIGRFPLFLLLLPHLRGHRVEVEIAHDEFDVFVGQIWRDVLGSGLDDRHRQMRIQFSGAIKVLHALDDGVGLTLPVDSGNEGGVDIVVVVGRRDGRWNDFAVFVRFGAAKFAVSTEFL